jgi:Putative Actinobacterial Holin-X, holin superfamily III
MERHSPSIKEPSDLHEDWSTLIARAADNVSRIVESEIHLFENTFRSALEGHINYALAGLAMLSMIVSGMLCALAALILYSHQWLPWWQACAIAAIIILAAAGVIRATAFAAPSKAAGTEGPDSKSAILQRLNNSEDGEQ